LFCDNGERVRVAFALECCDREDMSWVATTKGIDTVMVSDLMMQAVDNRFGSHAAPTKSIESKMPGITPTITPLTSQQRNGVAGVLCENP